MNKSFRVILARFFSLTWHGITPHLQLNPLHEFKKVKATTKNNGVISISIKSSLQNPEDLTPRLLTLQFQSWFKILETESLRHSAAPALNGRLSLPGLLAQGWLSLVESWEWMKVNLSLRIQISDLDLGKLSRKTRRKCFEIFFFIVARLNISYTYDRSIECWGTHSKYCQGQKSVNSVMVILYLV